MQPTFWKLPFEDLIGLKDIQFATLVLLIDIEKARFLDNVNDSSFVRNISTCHSNIVGSASQLLDLSKFRPHALRKLLELLCLALKPTTHEHETEIDQDTRLLLPIQIVTALSPITLKAIQALHCHDQHLDNLLAGTTGFIFTENSSYFGIDKELQPIVSIPEVIRQLGCVFLTAALSTLDTLIVMARDSKLKSHHDFSDGRMESLTRIRSIVLATQTFIHSWIGPNTLDILLTIYGEDDAGLSWLLKTMSLIDCKIHDIQSNHYQFLSSKDLLIQDEFNDLYIHLHRYAYPMDALFKFLEIIGFDYQTLLDLLLTLDDQQTGGMLAALMAILRNFTERESDQYNLSERWRRAMGGRVKDALEEKEEEEEREEALSEKFYVPFDDDVEPLSIENKCGNDDGSSDTRLILLNVEFCFSKLAQHIRRLHEKDLFPYNPRALLVVLDRTQLVLLSIINSK
ncbi:hypothetical protein BGZ46_001577 [Entomortierella lignicola]|nr:hypothetical protein BGZ46_001577 [Entomortierella lignicola]